MTEFPKLEVRTCEQLADDAANIDAVESDGHLLRNSYKRFLVSEWVSKESVRAWAKALAKLPACMRTGTDCWRSDCDGTKPICRECELYNELLRVAGEK